MAPPTGHRLPAEEEHSPSCSLSPGRKEVSGTAHRVLSVPPARGRVGGRLRGQQGHTVPEVGSLLPCTCFRQEKGKSKVREEKPTCQNQRGKKHPEALESQAFSYCL